MEERKKEGQTISDNTSKEGGKSFALHCDSDQSLGKVALDAYLSCYARFGWDPEKKKLFDKQQLLYARDATPEHYSVWFLPHSNYTKTVSNRRYWENTIFSDRIEEKWRVPSKDDHTDDKTPRVTFVKKENGKYYFHGMFLLSSRVESRDPETHKPELIKIYRKISDIYPMTEAPTGGISPDRLRSLKEFIQRNYANTDVGIIQSNGNSARYDALTDDIPGMLRPRNVREQRDVTKPIEERTIRSESAPIPLFLLIPEEEFAAAFLKMLERKGISNAECYTKANIDRKHFSKIISQPGYKPRKAAAIALILTMHPTKEEMSFLLEKLGYCLSHSSMFDLVIEWCVLHQIYDVDEINSYLYQLGLQLLGSIE